jgi:2-hydroxychromene-2-carboxylate isomerase
MSTPIDFYFACPSPWSYLAIEELKRIADAHGRTIAFKPIDVGRSWREAGAGQPLGNRPQVLQDYRLVELPRWAAWRKVPLNSQPKHFPTPFLMSSSVIIAARQEGTDVYALTQALMRGCWADELDISDADTVAKIADGAGLDGAALLAAAEAPAVADEMSANTDEALAAGAWSVPSFVVDGELFFGQDRLEMIAWRLDGGGR